MKILGIVCSPRPHGNTEILMEKALSSAKDAGAEVEMFTIAGKKLNPCDDCGECQNTGKCYIEDDMQPLYDKIFEADGIIFGCPVYYMSLCAQAKIILDRTFAFGLGTPLRNKVGATLIVGGRAGGTSAFSVFNNFFSLRRMICAGTAIAYGSEIGDVLKDQRGMEQAQHVGWAVVAYIKMVTQNPPAGKIQPDYNRRLDLNQ